MTLAAAPGDTPLGQVKNEPIGIFRSVSGDAHPEYGSAVTAQIAAAQDRNGPGDLRDLLHSGAIWTVD